MAIQKYDEDILDVQIIDSGDITPTDNVTITRQEYKRLKMQSDPVMWGSISRFAGFLIIVAMIFTSMVQCSEMNHRERMLIYQRGLSQ